MKLLKRDSRRPALKNWRFVTERVLDVVRAGRQPDWASASGALGAAAASDQKKQRQLEIMGRWAKLSRKLVRKHDGRASMQASVNLARLARKLVAQEGGQRQERAHRRLRSLSLKLLTRDA